MRAPDWSLRLVRYLDEAGDLPLIWARHDCATFAAGWVRECTGREVELPAYTDARSALRLIRQAGGLAALVDATGLARVPVPYAQRGDLALFSGPPQPRRGVLAVVDGVWSWAPGREQAVCVRTLDARHAWRVD